MTKARLYQRFDVVGCLLSEWRARAVLPYAMGNLMDLACGDNRLVRKNSSGVGVDIVNYKNVNVVCRNFSKLPFSDNEFDTVTILAALNYFEDPSAVLCEVSRILKPNGTLLVTLLNREVSRIWHSFRERKETPRPAFNETELNIYLRKANMRIYKKKAFMLGLNRIYFIKRAVSCQL